jgi:hypothetical protein
MGEMRNIYTNMAEKPVGGKRPYTMPMSRWENNIRAELEEKSE